MVASNKNGQVHRCPETFCIIKKQRYSEIPESTVVTLLNLPYIPVWNLLFFFFAFCSRRPKGDVENPKFPSGTSNLLFWWVFHIFLVWLQERIWIYLDWWENLSPEEWPYWENCPNPNSILSVILHCSDYQTMIKLSTCILYLFQLMCI